jgi:prophage antirepressor-like protein
VYKPIEEVQSIVSSLVENIYNDESYQDYLTDLKGSNENTKKLDTISKTFTDIQVFNTNADPLFLASDIGIILGVSSVNTMIKNYSTTEKINGMLIINGKPTKKIFLTRYGVYRIMFNNRSKLSDVFRAFIYKLLDYMESNGKDLSREIMTEINVEHPELVGEAMDEYKLERYKQLYELECNERKLLELTIENNYSLYKEIEDKKKEVEIEQTYNIMYIEQLKQEKNNMLDKIYNIKEDADLDEAVIALEFMKKKFFKEFTISLVKPELLSDVFSAKNSPYEVSEEDYVYNRYTKDFNFIMKVFDINQRINEDEIYYLTLALKTTAKKDISDKEIYITSDYIYDKAKFAELLELLKTECDYYQYPGSRKISKYIYKVSIEYIRSIVKSMISV